MSVKKNGLDLFDRFPEELIERIALYAPNLLQANKEKTAAFVKPVFDCLLSKIIDQNEAIGRFRSPMGTSREVVLQTVRNICLFNQILERPCPKDLNASNLLSMIEAGGAFRFSDIKRIIKTILELSHLEEQHMQLLRALLANCQFDENFRGAKVIQAARKGHLEVIRLLLALGAIDIEDRGVAVRAAVQKGYREIVNALLENGGEIEMIDRGMAVCSAAQNGHREIVNALLANGGQIDITDRGIAVCNAAQEGHGEIVKALLANGPISTDDRRLAIYFAASNGYEKIVDTLKAS